MTTEAAGKLPEAGDEREGISVVIVSYNVRSLLLECLASLRDCEAEIIVVDNASSDGTVTALMQVASHIKIIANSDNVGFARANNQAIKVASGRYVLLLNPDTQVLDNAISTMIEVMDNHHDVAIAGPRLLNPDETLQSACLRFPTACSIVRSNLLPVAPWRRRSRVGRHEGDHGVIDCDWVLGACLMVRREVLEQVGMLDEGYFMYGEEKDLCYRAKTAGWRVVCVPEAEVIHYGGQSAGQVPTRSYEAFLDSQFRFLGKFYSPLHGWLFGMTNYISCRLRQVVSKLIAWLYPAHRETWQQKSRVFAAGARRCAEHLLRKAKALRWTDRQT